MNIFKKTVRHMSEGIRRFIVVFAYTVVMYMAYVISVASFENALEELMNNIMYGCVQGCLAAILLRLGEERRHPDTPKQTPIALISLIPAIITTIILQCGYLTDKKALTTLICTGIAVIMFCAIMYILANNGHERNLYAWTAKSVIFTGFVAIVIGVGLSVCIAAASILLFSIDYRVYEYVLMFINMIIFINLLCSYIPKKDEELHITQLFKVIVAYVLLPIFLVLIAVLYLYIGKIAITLHMPSGEMNWFASLALAGWIFFWLTLRYIDNKLIPLFIRWGWILLVPVVIVQLIGVAIRLQAYGLTTARYLSLICTLLGVIAMIIAAIGKKPGIMIIIVAITTVIITISPFNILDVPAVDQYYRFTSLLSKYDKFDAKNGFVDNDTVIPAEDAERIDSSYSYLKYSSTDFGYINFDIDKNFFHTTEMSMDDLYNKLNMEDDQDGLYTDDDGSHYRTNDLVNTLDYVDTTDSSRIRPIDIYLEDGDYHYHEEFSDGTVVDADLSDYVEAINTYCSDIVEIDESRDYEAVFFTKDQSSIEIEGGRIWVSELTINEDYVTDTPDITISGYYLEY